MLVLILCLTPAFGGVFADTVTNTKTKEVIENVKTSENEQGIIVEYEDGTKRGFKKDAVSVEKKEVKWTKDEEQSKEETKTDRYFAWGTLTGLLILFFALP
ncbi:hypothetical protein EHQ12_03710 [Leptospira gomenensis]|uniref:Uncharacterized protein n=1 Tax=Leptospira gomenensis TaxID=2484974 RepID=A0A5F1Y8X9_9LEPT|nr:hypothetical protein EHQ17_12965 [Leptospira gomenensis]TGK41709.1 hypothetical protein EHQ07_16505 [Leptospira gomenensis]TGK43400.1 hypothetical protein EHQ12_03710 [Leptospira gomenensis]TGK61499.1 hypothetical protein EHQ13_08360 [Leptospira gomenensis]